MRITGVTTAVAEAAERAGRDPADITIVAVSKTVDRIAVDRAYALGLRNFGENRVPDAARKFAEWSPADTRLHMIGQLQTNKAGAAAAVFDLFQSVDRLSLVTELGKQGAKLARVLPVLLQVNVAGEEQKAGCEPAEVDALAAAIAASEWLRLDGLMTMAPLAEDAEAVRPVFAGLRRLRDQYQESMGQPLPVLSMGMSNDFTAAIAEGATHVRIGRAIFGP